MGIEIQLTEMEEDCRTKALAVAVATCTDFDALDATVDTLGSSIGFLQDDGIDDPPEMRLDRANNLDMRYGVEGVSAHADYSSRGRPGIPVVHSSAFRSQRPQSAAARYVLSRNAIRLVSGSVARRTAS